ncbi:serine protease 55-like [Toxorhynchites rutilus septentrionalis]|uniref:serine protease 55-like n=1 Tax=Toxorhynchites rutilus septentrionalis TaxID=329112 RepID=UPI002479E030|nr:serine protease 55-like [Toxorhynchites rutilus septentrionalis]
MNTRVVKFNLLPIILGLIGPGLFRLCVSLQCGIPRVRHEALIVRGGATRHGEWPWHAAIHHRTSPGSIVEYACGGSLISHQFVLTAAHCTVNQNTGNKLSRGGLFVRLGVHNLESIDPEIAQQYSVKNVYPFDKFSRQNMRNDIALLELNESVQLTDYVVPVCINRQFNLTNDVGTSVGWGLTENDEVSPVLRLARLPVIDDIDCLESDRDLFGKKFHKGMFCAGHTNGTSVCNGDSGGGLFFKRGEAWYVGGIVSFSKIREDGSNLCYTEGYAGFTKVAWYLTWISNVTGIDLDGDGYPNPKPVIKRKMVPYLPRLSDEKCLEYQQSRTPDSNDRNIVVIRDQGVQTCLANVISERYLLSTGSCVRRTIDQASFTAEFYTNRYNFRLHNLKPMLHPNQSTTTSGGVPRDSVVLIDLGRDRDELKPDIACLWTDPNEITKDVVKGVIWPTEIGSGAPFNISETHDGKAITTSENISCDDDRIILGVRISLRKVGESYYRMVGPLIHCETSMYARLTGYLDWIEETVWPKRTHT